MAEIRCPMCSKPNPDHEEACAFCGARLKPLVIQQAPEEPAATRDEGRPAEPSPSAEAGDWLSRIRPDAEPERDEKEQADQPQADEGSPDWLGRLRHADVDRDEGPPEGEIPEWLSEASEEQEGTAEVPGAAEVVPDWLSRIRAREATEVEESPVAPEPDEGEWLDRLRDTGEISLGEDAAVHGMELPGEALEEEDLEARQEPAEIDLPDLRSLDHLDEVPESELEWGLDRASDEAPPVAATPIEEGDFADQEISWPAPSEVEGEEEPFELHEAIESLPAEVPEEQMADEFDWPEPVDTGPSVSPFDMGVGELQPPEPSLPEAAPEKLEIPAPVEPERVLEESEPVSRPQDDKTPSTPAFILEDDDELLVQASARAELEEIDLPEWLAEMREGSAKEGPPGESVKDDLAPATLPTWLEAMRPIETFRSVVEIESAEDQVVESVGPLAGLRGILMAEPVVAMPRAATAVAASLDVTERQFAQTELLQRILRDEQREQPVAAAERAPMPVLRWIVSLFLILAVALPSLFTSTFAGLFPLPSLVPRDLGPLYALVESLPAEKPALIVFDYTPGFNGELGTTAAAFIEHLVARNVPLATLSTTPTGPPLAEALLNQYGVNGEDYIHLGYLSGGPTAVQVFSAAPRDAIPKGFMLPAEMEIRSGWQSELLRGVNRLSDFGMIAVITAGTDSARTWAEQARPWMADTPLVMVLSAGAEPLVRPYYEATRPQVNAILTGMPAAVAYEQQIGGFAADARTKWDAFGMGMFAVELLLIAGALYGVGQGLVRFGLKLTRGENR